MGELESIFGYAEPFILPESGDASLLFSGTVAETQVPAGMLKPFKVTNDEKGVVPYSFGGFLQRFEIDLSALEGTELFTTENWILALYNELENGLEIGNRPVIVISLTD